MKTFDGKNITKAEIQRILRSENVQDIFNLTYRLYGGVVKREQVFHLILDYAPTKRARSKACVIAYENTHECRRAKEACTQESVQRRAAWSRANQIQQVVQQFRYETSQRLGAHTQIPMMGFTHLYFCNPVFGHNDRHKQGVLPIAGNERLCELLCSAARKYLQREGFSMDCLGKLIAGENNSL